MIELEPSTRERVRARLPELMARGRRNERLPCALERPGTRIAGRARTDLGRAG